MSPFLTRFLLFVIAAMATCPFSLHGEDPASPANEAGVRFFESKIRPLFAAACYECHGADNQESGFRADTYAGLMRGGDSGVAMVARKPNESLLIAAIGYKDESLQMPPEKKLTATQIADVRRWIELGMPHPNANDDQPARRTGWNLAEARKFWSFVPPVAAPLPAEFAADARSPIDFFVRAKLEASQIAPNTSADRATLIRRLSFDLVGLPPSANDIQDFTADPAPDAFEKVADRLLASPRYGERWARHWLDVARYADSNGLDENIAHGNAWRYRDYVIAAMNDDKPFDRFIMEQVAGDLLDADSDDQRNEHLIATGYLALGPKVIAEGDEVKMQMDIIDEQMDAMGRSLMGLTIGCARCHDHKFDPISAEDYYGLAGIFKSTRTMESYKRIARWWENETLDARHRKLKTAHEARVKAKQQEIHGVIAEADSKLTEDQQQGDQASKDKLYSSETTKQLASLRKSLKDLEAAAPKFPTAMGVVDSDASDLKVHLRGSHLSLGKLVPRRLPVVLGGEQQAEFPTNTSGRMRLASWLVSDEHPLTSRVFVNRVWRWHFGEGIVSTTDNFGKLGEKPVNPELLDWLAVRFREDDWSVKRLHRVIVSSNAYRRSSEENEVAAAIDPANRLLWRSNVRRLEAEAIRDTLLHVGHQLDSRMGGSLLHVKNREFLFNHLSKDTTTYDSRKRSVYLPVIRNHLYNVFQLFDYSDASVLNGNRPTTTVASQALFLMNSDLIESVCQTMANDVLTDDSKNDADRLARLYWEVYGRSPNDREASRGLQFINKMTSLDTLHGDGAARQTAWQAFCQAMLAADEFIYVQ